MTEQAVYKIEVVFGHCESEMRYVQTGHDSVECQCRKKTFNQFGVCTETTPWSLLSRATNVSAEAMPMFLASGRSALELVGVSVR